MFILKLTKVVIFSHIPMVYQRKEKKKLEKNFWPILWKSSDKIQTDVSMCQQ